MAQRKTVARYDRCVMIPYGRHFIDEEDRQIVHDVLQTGWLTCGPYVEKFEEKICETVKSHYAVACSNGTTALHLSMLALGIGKDDYVFVPTITFLASANAARYVDANVIFVDVDPKTGLMTADTLSKAIDTHKHHGHNLKAVINVHLAGQCEDLKAIYDIAKKHNLFVIEDAAHAIGTSFIDKNKLSHPIGSNAFSDITTFSFHPVKTIAMGEGGAVTTNDKHIAATLRLYRSHGMIKDSSQWDEKDPHTIGPWYYEMQNLGYNYRISDINCALGYSQLTKLNNFKSIRQDIVSRYDEAFHNHPYIKPLHKLSSSDTAWHLYVAHFDFERMNQSRSDLMKHLQQHDIGTQVHYIPVHTQPYYRKLYGGALLEGANSYYKTCLSLPLYVGLSKEDQNKIIDVILSLDT